MKAAAHLSTFGFCPKHRTENEKPKELNNCEEN
jgi:hypothetical protein